MIFSSVTKIYSTISGRRFDTDLREAKARGYLMHMPHSNSVFKYLESEALTPYLYELISISAQPLTSIETASPLILADSTPDSLCVGLM